MFYAFGGLVFSHDGHLSDPVAASAWSSPRAPRRPLPGGSLQSHGESDELARESESDQG